MSSAPVVVVGGGHNGLVAACYLAKAGRDVLVLEAADAPGGGSRTEETIPGHRFNTHSAAHNIINMTRIPAELDLAGAGLRYTEMEPFATGVFTCGRTVRFHRSIERTVASIAEHDRAQADAYAAFMHRALPLARAAVAGLEATSPSDQLRLVASRLPALVQAARRAGGVRELVHDLLSPYGSLLRAHLPGELTRAPVAAFAAHGSAGPHVPGSAFFAMWQAAYHLHGQWHPLGGSQALTDALVARFDALGGTLRTDAPVRLIHASGGRARGVTLADGEYLPAAAVVTAVDIRTALLEMLDPPLRGRLAAQLAAVHRGNAVQLVVHLATDALPPYPDARPGDWNGLQSHVDTLDELQDGFLAAEAGHLPDPPPTYAFTPSVYDPSLAPAGRHTVYLACPSAPARVRGGWAVHAEAFADAMITQVEQHAPGFRHTVQAVHVHHPELMARRGNWPGAHPMYLDITPDQLALLRPVPALAGHTVPGVSHLVTCGASTAPTGGIAGASGKAAAQRLLEALARS